ncbi:Pyr-redox-2 domain-containing protein [Mycena chlorophos]|uniref:Pyr-redox-2 domain-containing protein n=1 Tax=Mycena chlorophos TaxID=658473 RepID=A0A8H6SFQ5_MYCCL|nr:Pyr-redox-2 domain-containing protein [Mycena chlorophos]
MSSKLVVIGTGFAGMWAALSAARKRELAAKTDQLIVIVVIAPEPTLYVRPRFYEGLEGLKDAQAPLSDLFATVGVQFVSGTVDSIDFAAKSLKYRSPAGEPAALAYDRLVLASGSVLYRPESIAGLSEFAFDADTMPSALKLDEHLQSLAALPPSPARNTVVIGGGGFTGAEVAAEMPSRLRRILGVDVDVRVLVLEKGDHYDFMGEKAMPVVQEAFASLGIEVLTGQGVIAVDADGVTTLQGLLPCERDDLGRLFVTQELKVPGINDVFAAGDTINVAADDKGHVVYMSCQHAMNLGKTAGNNAMADLLGIEQEPYSQPIYGTCLSLGSWGAVYTNGWEREVKMVKEEGYKMKRYINTELIAPPLARADKANVFEAANPLP